MSDFILTELDEDTVRAESPEWHNSSEAIEFVKKERGGDYLMKVLRLSNPYLVDGVNWAWVLVRVKG